MSNCNAAEDFPFPLDKGLPEAICCEAPYAEYAEPKFTYNRTDV